MEYRGDLYQFGMLVARVEGSNAASVRREIAHYILMYGQDGEVEPKFYFRRKAGLRWSKIMLTGPVRRRQRSRSSP